MRTVSFGASVRLWHHALVLSRSNLCCFMRLNDQVRGLNIILKQEVTAGNTTIHVSHYIRFSENFFIWSLRSTVASCAGTFAVKPVLFHASERPSKRSEHHSEAGSHCREHNHSCEPLYQVQ